jgi:hypothetical protein
MKRLLLQFLALFPTKLPTGVTEFESFADKFIATYDLPTKDAVSVRFTLASILMNLHDKKPTAYTSLLKIRAIFIAAASKQVAGYIFYNIKEAQATAKASSEPQHDQAANS